jgi:hypothetical protein
MAGKNCIYIGIQKKSDHFSYIEMKVPDYESFEYTVKVVTHDTGFANWYATYEIYDRNKELVGIKLNGWETNSYVKQEGPSWKGGSILRIDVKDNKGVRRIINFKEMNFTNKKDVWRDVKIFSDSYQNFESMVADLVIFFNTFSDWNKYDENNKSMSKDDVIHGLIDENKKLKEVINNIKKIITIENTTDNKV